MNTEQRILALLRSGPMTVRQLCHCINQSGRNIERHLRNLRAKGLVASEMGEKDPSTPGTPALEWRLGKQPKPSDVVHIEREDDELWPKRATGYGTNPPGAELDRVWRGL